MLDGAVGGTLQWYHNGIAIPGATGPTYIATDDGYYNQMQTNDDGCSDTAAVPFNIYDGPGCDLSVGTFNANLIELYPNPVTDNLTISSNANVRSIRIYNTFGQLVIEDPSPAFNTNYTLNVSHLSSGTYIIQLDTDTNVVVRKIIK